MKVSPRDILFIFFSKLHVMVGVFLTVVILVAVKTLSTDPVYQVSAAVLIRPLVDSRLSMQTDRFTVAPVSQEDVNTEIKLMSSKEVMRDVAVKMGRLEDKEDTPAPDAERKRKRLLVKWGIEFEGSREDKIINDIRSGLDISAVSMSNMVQVTKQGDDPVEITEILKTFLDCYIDRHIEAHQTAGSVEFHSQQVKFYETRIFELEERLKEYDKGYFIIAPNEQESFFLKFIQQVEYDLGQLKTDIAGRQKQVDAFKQSMAKHGELTMMNQDYRSNTMLTELAKVYIPMVLEKERVQSLYPKSSPEYKDTIRQIRQLRKEFLTAQKQFLNGLELDLHAQLNKEKVLTDELDRIKTEVTVFKEKEIGRSRLLDKLNVYKRNHQIYTEKLEEARITEEREKARAANVFVSNWPSEPSKPASPNVKARLLLSLPAGIIAAIGAALAAFYLDHTVKRPEDLDRFAGANMLSSIGFVRER
ncbi:MAG: GumC family protein [Candidatus Electrothrix sp. YB6]